MRFFPLGLALATHKEFRVIICSECFNDEGLKISASSIGLDDADPCDNCGSSSGKKLDKDLVTHLSNRFFVWGTLKKCKYGAAPVIQFNQNQKTDMTISEWLKDDLKLIEDTIGVGFFHYGPRLWMVGEVEPLKDLQNNECRAGTIQRILKEYPELDFGTDEKFYRIRNQPAYPKEPNEYDSPPPEYAGNGRLDSSELSILYGSQDLQLCIHECRVTAEDELYVATLKPKRALRLLNLSEVLNEDTTEFESLDMAVHMLFLAGEYSYKISREIAVAARNTGYDGMIFPSYFSLLRTGAMPFETTYGLSHRRIPSMQEHENSKISPNLALFGQPIAEGLIEVVCINKLVLHRVEYNAHFGPVEY